MIETTYKTAWYMLAYIRSAMGQRNETHEISRIVEFNDAYFGGPTVGQKRDYNSSWDLDRAYEKGREHGRMK